MTGRTVAFAAVVSFVLAAGALAEPPGKPPFLAEGDNGDIAYCYVVLNGGRFSDKPNDFSTSLKDTITAAYLWTILEERAGKSAKELSDEIVPWTKKAVDEDVAATGAPRLSSKACHALADTLKSKA